MKKMALIAVLIVALVAGLAAYAYANPLDVTVSAKVMPKIELEITQGALDFGDMYPDDTDNKDIDVRIRANKAVTCDRDYTAGSPDFRSGGLTVIDTDSVARAYAKAEVTGPANWFTDNVDVTVPWTADEGTYTGTYTYTVY
jgi:hypothetical protein